MTGTIVRVTDHRSELHDADYTLAVIRLEDGSTATTYLTPGFRNFARWQPLLRVGARLKGLRMKGRHVDADSPVEALPSDQPELNL